MNRLLKKVLLSLMITFLIALNNVALTELEAVAPTVEVVVYKIPATSVETTINNFPVTVVIDSTNPIDLDGLTAREFLFTSSNSINIPDTTNIDYNNSLLYEADYFDAASDKAVFHVNVPIVSSVNDTYFYMYYGTSVKSQETRFDNDMTGLTMEGNDPSNTNDNSPLLVTQSDMDKVLKFSSKADLITVSDSSNQLNIGAGDFTLEMRVLTSSTLLNGTSYPGLLQNGNVNFSAVGDIQIHYGRSDQNSDRFSFIYYAALGGSLIQINSNSFNDGEFHNFVLQRSDGNLSMYVDGALQGATISFTNDVDFSRLNDQMHIGGPLGNSYGGKIAFVRISNNARPINEIATINKVTNDSNTLFATNFDTVWDDNYKTVLHMDSGLIDMTGNRHNGESSGGTAFNSTDLLGSVASFDGTDDKIVLANSTGMNYYPLTVVTRILPGNEQLSVVLNKYTTSSLNGYNLFYNYGSANNGLNMYYFKDSSNYLSDYDPTLVTSISGTSYNVFGYTVGSNLGKSYIDGTVVKTQAWTGTATAPSDANPVSISYYTGDGNYTSQFIDELRVSNTERSETWLNLESKTLQNNLLEIISTPTISDNVLIDTTETSTMYLKNQNLTLFSEISIQNLLIPSFVATVVIENPETGDVLTSSNGACVNISALDMYNGTSQIGNTSITCTSSTASELVNLLKTIKYDNTNNISGTRTITTYLGNKVYNPENNHFYEISSNLATWSVSNNSAGSQNLYGLHGYLGTIKIASEHSLVKRLMDASSVLNSYLGGYKIGINTWNWTSGPELDTPVSLSAYWASGQPSNTDSSTTTPALEYWINNSTDFGLDDVDHTANLKSIIEYGGMGNDTVTILDSFDLTYSEDTTGPTISGVTAGTIEIYMENASSYTPVTATYSDNVAVSSSSIIYLYSDGVTEFAGADDAAKLEAFRTHLSNSNTAILKYTATDVNNNTTTVLVTVHSSKAPVTSTTVVEDLVVIKTPSVIEYELGDKQELKAIATHVYGFTKEDITPSMSVTGSVDFNRVGIYPVTYTATYGDVTSTVTVEYSIVDLIAPEIYVAPVKTVFVNSDYALDEYIVSDNYDKDVTVIVKDPIKIGVAGMYTVTYTAMDDSGNSTSTTQLVSVEFPELLTKIVYVDGSSYIFSFTENEFDFDTLSLFVAYGSKVPFVDGNWTEGATTVQPGSNDNVYLMMMDKDGNYKAKLIQGAYDGTVIEVFSDEPINYSKEVMVNDVLIKIELNENFDLSSTKLYSNHGIKLPFFDDSWQIGYGIMQVPEHENLYLLFRDAAGHTIGQMVDISGNISISKPLEVE